MVISKCVPLAISRNKFSNFDLHTTPENMVLVGYKTVKEESNDGKEKNVNIRLNYNIIKDDIIKTIKNDPQWGQGGENIVAPEIPVTPVTPVALETYAISVTSFDEFDEPIRVTIENGGTWDTENKTNFLDVKQRQALIEINSGGKYTSDYIYIYDPMNGSVSHIVVDNTGLPNEDGTVTPPETNFVLYYGGEDNCYEILSVPPMCRGVIQVLHSKNMNMDFILHSSYVDVPSDVDVTRFVPDQKNENDDFNNTPVDKSPTMITNADTFYINMNEEKGFFEFYTREHDSYTFVFSSPELGSSTYMVINNCGENYHGHPVKIRYGKIMDVNNNGIHDDSDLELAYEITEIENEIAIIEIFHSLSADFVVKITKI